MKKTLRTLAACIVAACTALAGACTPTTTPSGSTANTTPANNNAAAPPTTASNASAGTSATNTPVTLPVLDAMFADEAFAGELKSKLQLTDEQVERLRSIAREETASLRETETGEHEGTTSEATRRAQEKIREAVGEEKARQLAQFVSERWGGGTATASSKPNAVPTDTRIVVNIPAYRMDAFENGRLIKSYVVGIGYPEFPLPTGLRKAETIIFNPEWTPPDEPWVESAKGNVKPGQKVPAGSKLNPLGLVKIPIGSPSLIHGGKSPARLGTFASHGCVGLTNQQVQNFAPLMARLGGVEISQTDVAAYAKEREETKNVKLANPVPVELRYETIVVEDGKLHIYRDVYDRDTNTEENLRAVLEANGVRFEQLSEQERTQALDALRQMARDATGRPTSEATPTPTPTPDKKSAQNKKGGERVTRAVKGQKEIVVEIAALQGKGYPAPVDLDTGGAPQPKQQRQQQQTASAAQPAGRRP
ncbi:MAG TPA: L,D-transpeptidase [Pyrinomonadaceae bacterium]|nr:L,D-transpeptidase [Pyrinomonadaceae bacterium]